MKKLFLISTLLCIMPFFNIYNSFTSTLFLPINRGTQRSSCCQTWAHVQIPEEFALKKIDMQEPEVIPSAILTAPNKVINIQHVNSDYDAEQMLEHTVNAGFLIFHTHMHLPTHNRANHIQRGIISISNNRLEGSLYFSATVNSPRKPLTHISYSIALKNGITAAKAQEEIETFFNENIQLKYNH